MAVVELKTGIKLDMEMEELKLLLDGVQDKIQWIEGTLPKIEDIRLRIMALTEQMRIDWR